MSIFSCENLHKTYGSTRALDGVTLDVEAGQPIALIGPNGAGKTTLLSLLCGYIRATSGQIKLLGNTPGSAALNGRVSALPQDAQLDPRFSVGRQLQFYAELQGLNRQAARRDIDRVLELVNLPDAKDASPQTLSHGMRKRVAIAQALIGEPELVLLDEPTAGLDPANAKAIRDLIAVDSNRANYVVSSHNLDELEKLCEKVLYLENGKLREQVDLSNDTNDGYLTIKLARADSSALIVEIEKLAGFINVSQKQKNELVVQFDEVENPQIDQQILKVLAANSWSYRQLIKGRTLEEKLF